MRIYVGRCIACGSCGASVVVVTREEGSPNSEDDRTVDKGVVVSTPEWGTEGLARANSRGLDVRMVQTAHECVICMRHAVNAMFAFRERPERASSLPEEADWLLCAGCAAAVLEEVQRAALRTSHRLRIAIGIVASERNPYYASASRIEQFWDDLLDRKSDSLVIGYVLLCVCIPSLIFLLVLAVSAANGS